MTKEGLMPDILPWLLVRCDTCPDECNCYPADEVRWTIPMPGFPDAAPMPVCEGCWDGAHSDDFPLPCDWSELPRVEVRLVR